MSKVECHICRGTGEVTPLPLPTRPCEKCDGSGYITVNYDEPDDETVELRWPESIRYA